MGSCITCKLHLQGVPYPALPRRDKPRRVDLYFSSWVIKPGKNYEIQAFLNEND